MDIFIALLVGAEERKPAQKPIYWQFPGREADLLREDDEDAALTYEVQDHFLLLGSKLRIAHLPHYTFTNTLFHLDRCNAAQTFENNLVGQWLISH